MNKETVKSDKFKSFLQSITPLLTDENNPALADILKKADQPKKTISLGAVNEGKDQYVDTIKNIYEKTKELFEIVGKKGDNKFIDEAERDARISDKFNEIAEQSHKLDAYFKKKQNEHADYFDNRMFKLAKDINNVISSFDNYSKIFEEHDRKIEDNENKFNKLVDDYSVKQTELLKQANLYKIQQVNEGKNEPEKSGKENPLYPYVAECFNGANKIADAKNEAKQLHTDYSEKVNAFQEAKKAELSARENRLLEDVLNSKKKFGFDSSYFKDVANAINNYKADKTNEENRNKLLSSLDTYIEKRDVGNSKKTTDDGQKRLDAIKELRNVLNREKSLENTFAKDKAGLPDYTEKFVNPKSKVEFNMLNTGDLKKKANLVNPEKIAELTGKFAEQESKLLEKLGGNKVREKAVENKNKAVPEKKPAEPVVGGK